MYNKCSLFRSNIEGHSVSLKWAHVQGNGVHWQVLVSFRAWAFLPENGGRAGAAKVMVVVTDGESHDKALRNQVIQKCQEKGITRFGIAVSEGGKRMLQKIL